MIDDPLNRLKVKRGTELPQSKLNEKLVRQIREDYEEARAEIKRLQTHFSIAGMAKKYGVSKPTMEKAISGITWGHVE